MARATKGDRGHDGPIISIVGPGMRVVGDVIAEGSVRVEGEVKGTIVAGKAVVVGKEGTVAGDISTQDGVISGRVEGTITAASRLEIQATASVDGAIRTRRLQLEEGAVLNAEVEMGEVSLDAPSLDGGKAGRKEPEPPPAPPAVEIDEAPEQEEEEGAKNAPSS
jgi:cytoskeletal protein CcmA (bactofilin family)